MANKPIGNPFRELATARSLTIAGLATELAMSHQQARSYLAAGAAFVKENNRAGIEATGVDFDELRRAYARYVDQLAGAPLLEGVDLEQLGEPERRIAAAILSGVRGVRNIADAAGVRTPNVTAFLRAEHPRVG
jgi:hypothetical protein